MTVAGSEIVCTFWTNVADRPGSMPTSILAEVDARRLLVDSRKLFLL